MTADKNQDFHVVAYEAGAENPSLPTWASRSSNPAKLDPEYSTETIARKDFSEPRGTYQLLNVLSQQECQELIQLSEALGYLPDAAVSLPRSIRHNDNIVWVTDEQTDAIIWQRVQHLASQNLAMFGDKKPLGINARFRFYRYSTGDYFKPHTDGAWPGSRVVNGKLVTNAYPDRYSQMSFLIFLNDDYSGGATRFVVHEEDRSSPTRRNEDKFRLVDIRTPAGAVLCFPHGMHLLHCVHSSEPITRGVKYIIRTDMLFEI